MSEYKAYTICNEKGTKVVLTDIGATVVSIFVKNKNGEIKDVVTGYDDLDSYKTQTCFFGATVGRNCNRIANAAVNIDGVEYKLEANDNENNLHSGSNTVAQKKWTVKASGTDFVTFEIVSKDLEQGFPGNATITVTYSISENDELSIQYRGVSDKKTVFNMTNHCYFNLNGHESGSVYSHELQINAKAYTPVSSQKAIPTGELAPVEGTPFDFRTVKEIGADIEQDNEQLYFANGYDHNYAIDKTTEGVEKVATAYSPASGIAMDVLTDCVGIQLYTANFIGGQIGKGNVKYKDRDAFCLETQYFPNSINEPNFATPLTDAGEVYESKTIYKFSIR